MYKLKSKLVTIIGDNDKRSILILGLSFILTFVACLTGVPRIAGISEVILIISAIYCINTVMFKNKGNRTISIIDELEAKSDKAKNENKNSLAFMYFATVPVIIVAFIFVGLAVVYKIIFNV